MQLHRMLLHVRFPPMASIMSIVARAPQCHAFLRYRSLQTPTVPEASAFRLSTICTCPLALQVTADIRGIQSREFYTYHSLRFPRVVDHGIRWDKGAADVETTEHFNRLLADAKGTFLGELPVVTCTPSQMECDKVQPGLPGCLMEAVCHSCGWQAQT